MPSAQKPGSGMEGPGWNRVLDFILQYLVWQTSIIYMQVDMNGIDRMPRRSSCLLVCNETQAYSIL